MTSLDDFLNRDWRTFSSLDAAHKLMSRFTGKPIGEHEALVQRIVTILATPIGSRVFMREFGSELPRLIDHPINALFYTKVYNATADAINRWEPVFRLNSTSLTQTEEARFEIFLEGESLIDGQALSIGDIILDLKGTSVVRLRESLAA